jgi:hypothetical protein
MNTGIQQAADGTQAPPEIRPATFDDYPSIQALEAANLPEALPADEWQRMWLDSPLWPRLGKNWPIGWVLQDDSGRIVGSLGNVPSSFVFRGQELVCGNGRAWVVLPEYRGFALWLMDEYFNQPDAQLFVNTTVNAVAAQVFSTLSERIPLGDWQTSSYWVTGYRGFARGALDKIGVPLSGVMAVLAGGALRIRDAMFARRLPAPNPALVIAEVANFDNRFEQFWNELVRQNPDRLLGLRDSRTLAWHYAIPLRRRQLWIYTVSRNGQLRGYCVFKRQDTSQGLRRMRLIDFQSLDPDVDLLPGLLQTALSRCAAEGLDMLELVGRGVPKLHSFDDFAPHSRKLPNWAFYFHAADPALQKTLQAPAVWDPSEYDGDASFA